MTTDEIATSDLFDLYAFPVSRQLYALNRVALALVGCNDDLLTRWVVEALRLGEQAYELQVDFARRRSSTQFGAQARIVDRKLDRALGAVAKFMAAIVQAYGETSAQAELARFATGRLFPEGVAAVIHLPYVEEEIAVRMLLRRAKTQPELSRALGELGANPFLEQVAALHARYQEALRDTRPRPSFAQVKQARQAGQERLCQILALLVVRVATGGQKADHMAALRKALGAITAQNAAIGRLHRRRRRVTEVDPQTGEEVDAEVDPQTGEEVDAEVDPEAGEEKEAVVESEGDPETPEEREAWVDVEAAEGVVEAEGKPSRSFDSGDVLTERTIEAFGERFAEPWSPGDLAGMHVQRGLAMRRHHEQPRAG